MITVAAHEEAIRRLSEPARLAFACGCTEHVFPVFDALFEGRPIRKALDAAWGAILNGPLSRVQEAALKKGVIAVVPNIRKEPTLRAELGMNIGDLTVDVLGCAAGNASMSEQIGVGVLDVLTVALDAFKGEDPGEWRHELEDPERLHPLLREEWQEQASMLAELSDSQLAGEALTWREDQRQRGREVANRLGVRTPR
jgi:hypothetical protein